MHEDSSSVTRVVIDGDIATLSFERPQKRNAVNEALVEGLDGFFSNIPKGVNAVVLKGSGGHFCAGLDLEEHEHRDPIDNVFHSRNWHRIMDAIEYGGVPVISALEGAVIGGGLEIATSTKRR